MLQTGLICRFRPLRLFSPVHAMARVGVHEGSTVCTPRLGLSASSAGGLPAPIDARVGLGTKGSTAMSKSVVLTLTAVESS